MIFSLHLGVAVGHSVLLQLFSNHHISKCSGPPPTHHPPCTFGPVPNTNSLNHQSFCQSEPCTINCPASGVTAQMFLTMSSSSASDSEESSLPSTLIPYSCRLRRNALLETPRVSAIIYHSSEIRTLHAMFEAVAELQQPLVVLVSHSFLSGHLFCVLSD